jgi:hypothetical protein
MQSVVCGDFPASCEKPRIGGVACERFVSAKGQLDFRERFGAVVSGLEIPFPGDGDRRRQRPVRICHFTEEEGLEFGIAETIRLASQRGERIPCRERAGPQ